MAATPEELARITNNENNIAAIYAGTIDFASMNGTQKRTVIENIFPSGVAIDINDPNIKAGDKVFGVKAEINNGKWCFGVVVNPALTDDTHITFNYREV